MNYTIQPYASSVPHIILVPDTITISTQYYIMGVILQSIFAAISLLLMGFTISFCCRNQDILDQKHQTTSSSQNQVTNNNLICKDQNNLRPSIISAGTDLFSAIGKNTTFGPSFWNITTQLKMKQFSYSGATNTRIYQRRLIYFLSFLGLYIICFLTFDLGIISIAGLAIQIVIFIFFNMCRFINNWKITLFFYILPMFIPFFEYLQGTHKLYEWTSIISE